MEESGAYLLAAPARNAPPQSGLRPASTTFCGIAATGSYVRFNSLRDAPLFYGIAATGSYFRFNSLRDAPPGGEAFNLPLRGRGTAAAVEEGRYGSELYVLSYRSRPEHPSSVSLTRASSPGGEAFNLPRRGRRLAAGEAF